MPSKSNGQLIAAVAVLVDAIFGVLVAVNVVHVRPDQSVTVIAVTAAFNIGSYVWAYIQHQQHVVKMQIAGASGIAAVNAKQAPPSVGSRR